MGVYATAGTQFDRNSSCRSDQSVLHLSNQKSIWQRTYGNFAPRLGLAYRPFAESSTVLRAAWGIYYDSSLSIATDLINGGPFSLSQFVGGQNAPFPSLLTYGFMPGLRVPTVNQWSGSIEHTFSGHQLVSAVYEGSAGRQLLRREVGFADTDTLQLVLATNHGDSSYQALQLQYRLRASHGLSGMASYSWSHSIDNGSSDSLLYWAGPEISAADDRGSSRFRRPPRLPCRR